MVFVLQAIRELLHAGPIKIEGKQYRDLIDFYYNLTKSMQKGSGTGNAASRSDVRAMLSTPQLTLYHLHLTGTTALACDVVHWAMADYCAKRVAVDSSGTAVVRVSCCNVNIRIRIMCSYTTPPRITFDVHECSPTHLRLSTFSVLLQVPAMEWIWADTCPEKFQFLRTSTRVRYYSYGYMKSCSTPGQDPVLLPFWKKAPDPTRGPLELDLGGRVPVTPITNTQPPNAPQPNLVGEDADAEDTQGGPADTQDPPADTSNQFGGAHDEAVQLWSLTSLLVNATARAVCQVHQLMTSPEAVMAGGASPGRRGVYLAAVDRIAIKEYNKCKIRWGTGPPSRQLYDLHAPAALPGHTSCDVLT